MGGGNIEHLQPNDVIAQNALAQWDNKQVPLTLEDGTTVGIAKITEVDDGFEIEAILDEEHKDTLSLEGTALSLSATEARVVNEQKVLEKEQKELNNLFGLYSVLRGQREQKQKEKTRRRAASKRARKSRKGNR